MALGINLSFCARRWVTPKLWAPVVREQLGLGLVQFSFDLVDPLWPDAVLADCARDIRAAAQHYHLQIHSAFTGRAHYTFNQLLHPDPRVRDFAGHWLERAFHFAALAGIGVVGGPAGAIASRVDGMEADSISAADYGDLVARLHRLAEKAGAAGLTGLAIEPTPLRREWPWTPAQAKALAADLRGSQVPVSFCLDWGSATLKPVYGSDGARVQPWLDALGHDISMVHLQQGDGILNRHWDFSGPGMIDPGQAAAVLAGAGLAGRPVFLEVHYPFERADRSILAGLHQSCAILSRAFGAGG